MSHWIESFALVEAASSRPILTCRDPNWSLEEAQWSGSSVVKLSVRKYPGNHNPSQFDIEADCATSLARVQGGPPIPFTQVEATLEVLLRQSPGVSSSNLP